MTNIPRFLELAARESEKSVYQHKIGCIISKGKRVLARGHNELRYKSVGSVRYSAWECSLHAERMACAALPREELRGTTIWIARKFVSGEYALALPCDQCKRLITDMNIARVIYSISTIPYFEVVNL